MDYRGMSKAELIEELDKLRKANAARADIPGSLQQSEGGFRSLYSAMSEGVCLHEVICDESGRAVNYRILDVNPAYEAIMGFAREKVVGATATDAYGVVIPPYLDTYAAVAKTGNPAVFETFFPPISKHFNISVFSSGDGRFATVFSDITERKRAEKSLRESEERFRTVLDSVSDGVLLADAKTQDFFMANKTICDMLGYSQEEMRELHVEDIHPEEDLPEVRAVFGRQLAGEIKLAPDIPVKRKDGSIFYADINSAPVMIGGREYIVGVFRDITERREAEEARRELETEKVVIEKMKELDRIKDEFVSTVTHELRTPMTPLRSTIEMFLDGSLGETSPQQRKFIEMMARNIERLAQFTTEVLTLSRLESGKYKLFPRSLPLVEVIEPVMDLMLTRASSRKSSLRLDVTPQLSVFADPDSLGMVVTNLANNAIVHTPEGTSVTISARHLNDDFVEISVSDTGEGIEQEHLENLFQRFYQAKRRASATYKGTGIGLAVCKALVEAMGGRISVESRVGEGTTFTFTVPARQA